MIHLDVTNKPKALKGENLTHRCITCLAFDYVQDKRELAIYETFKQWYDKTPEYRFVEVETITCLLGATNGDIIESMFPNIEVNEIKTDTGGYIEVKYLDTTDKCDATAFRKNWWYAPYRGGNSDDR